MEGNSVWKILLEGNSAVCSSLLCSLPAPSLDSKQHRCSTRLAELLWPLQELGGSFGNEEQWKTAAELPGISSEASHVSPSVTPSLVPAYQGCRGTQIFAKKSHPKALPLKLFQCWCFGDISPFPVLFPGAGRSKGTSKFAEDVCANSLKVIHTHYIATLLNTGPEAFFKI